MSDSTPRASENQPGTPHDTHTADQAQGAAPDAKPARRRRRTPAASANGEPPAALPPTDNGEAETGGQTQPASASTETPRPPLIPGINLDDVALGEDYEQPLAEDEALAVTVDTASRQGFFRAHPTLHRPVWVMEIKKGADKGYYLVAKKALALLRLPENDDVQLFRCRLTVCFGRDVGLFLWPVRLPQEGKENQSDEWGRSALRICKIAEDTWVKMWGKRGGKQYSHRPAPDIRTTPPWPEGVTLDELATLGFEGRYVTDPDDPVIRRQLGKE